MRDLYIISVINYFATFVIISSNLQKMNILNLLTNTQNRFRQIGKPETYRQAIQTKGVPWQNDFMVKWTINILPFVHKNKAIA